MLLFAGVLFQAAVANAQNPLLRDIEVRSFLGEPLNLRIALAASAEHRPGVICQSVIDDDRRDNVLHSSDLVLTTVALRGTRYLRVRGRTAFNEPVARFSLRFGCPGEPVVDREFTVLLDPPPFTALPVVPARAKPVVPASGRWSVHEGDSVAWLAKGIHPKNRARQRQYIAVLRELNPQIAGIADDAPLTPGMQLALPDLLTLSGILPRPALAEPPSSPPVATKKTPAAETPVARAAAQAAPKPAASTSAAATAATPPPAKSAAPKSAPAAARTGPALPAPAARAAPRGEGFQLRLSGSEMDLSRSRNVTDEQRRLLREKQLTLDADDQLSALLSLKNTVKQLEQRLNEMQLQLAASASIRPAAPSPPIPAPPIPAVSPAASTPAAPTVAAPAQKLPSAPAPAAPAATPAQTPTAAPVIAPATPTPAPPAPVTQTTPVTLPLEKIAAPEPSFADTIASYLPSPLLAGGIVAALFALLAAWGWSRRAGTSKNRADSVMPGASGFGATPASTTAPNAGRASRASRGSTPEPSRAIARDPGYAGQANQPAEDAPSPAQPAGEAFMRTSHNLQDDAAAAHSQVDAPVIFDDTPASYELDSRPATTVDFLVGMDEKLPEDRVRRLQYMHERYPELKSNTISIDDADSVINAARLYYEEAAQGTGRDKASELLTFAVEERPQEIRFWLAQFEIFRLENMVAEFTAMAGKFHVLFNYTPAWPKVRHIGHELDPGNPLFAAGGSPLLAGETRFDPIGENWLNSPMDFTSDALMSDLRLALLDDHGVSRADFESITARLTATTGAVPS